jgi:hypothetical protein
MLQDVWGTRSNLLRQNLALARIEPNVLALLSAALGTMIASAFARLRVCLLQDSYSVTFVLIHSPLYSTTLATQEITVTSIRLSHLPL